MFQAYSNDLIEEGHEGDRFQRTKMASLIVYLNLDDTSQRHKRARKKLLQRR